MLHQRITITFTQYRRQQPLSEIEKDLTDFLTQNTTNIPDPTSMVGQRICHKFELEESHEERSSIPKTPPETNIQFEPKHTSSQIRKVRSCLHKPSGVP